MNNFSKRTQDLSTAHQFQLQKQWFALSSRFRPSTEAKLECNFRQTLFPSLMTINEMNEPDKV